MKQKGFTLIEVVVVMAIFLTVIVSAVAVLVNTINQQRQILQEQELLSQVSYAQEYMSRSMRAAVQDVGGSCLFDQSTSYPGGQFLLTHFDSDKGIYQGIKFINKDAICEEFYFDSQAGVLNEVKNGGSPVNIIASDFKITNIAFILNGDKNIQLATQTDGIQPRVTIFIDVQKNVNSVVQEKRFQTTVSQRNLNLLP